MPPKASPAPRPQTTFTKCGGTTVEPCDGCHHHSLAAHLDDGELDAAVEQSPCGLGRVGRADRDFALCAVAQCHGDVIEHRADFGCRFLAIRPEVGAVVEIEHDVRLAVLIDSNSQHASRAGALLNHAPVSHRMGTSTTACASISDACNV